MIDLEVVNMASVSLAYHLMTSVFMSHLRVSWNNKSEADVWPEFIKVSEREIHFSNKIII